MELIEKFYFAMDEFSLNKSGLIVTDDSEFSCNKALQIGIAVSGGIDSMVLLNLSRKYAAKSKITLRCINIDHQLRLESAEDSLFVQKYCATIPFCESTGSAIKCDIINWTGHKPIADIQNKARNARYALISKWAFHHNIDCVLLGHNLNDQIETFFMRVGKGSGPYGLACMSAVKKVEYQIEENTYQSDYMCHDSDSLNFTDETEAIENSKTTIDFVRPMLSASRSEIENYAKQNMITWRQDSSNSNRKFQRVRIRDMLSTLEYRDTEQIALSILRLGESRIQLEQEADEILKNIRIECLGYITIEISLLKTNVISWIVLNHLIRIIRSTDVRLRENQIVDIITLSENVFYSCCGCLFIIKCKKLFIIRDSKYITHDYKLPKNVRILWDNRFYIMNQAIITKKTEDNSCNNDKIFINDELVVKSCRDIDYNTLISDLSLVGLLKGTQLILGKKIIEKIIESLPACLVDEQLKCLLLQSETCRLHQCLIKSAKMSVEKFVLLGNRRYI
jgi:tRNA(Ile)-lysidine synthase